MDVHQRLIRKLGGRVCTSKWMAEKFIGFVLNISCTNGRISKTLKEVFLHRKKVWFNILALFREGPPAVRRTWGPAKKFYLLQVGLISHLEIELAYSKNISNSIWERCKLFSHLIIETTFSSSKCCKIIELAHKRYG